MKINVAATSHIGNCKKRNQDRILVRIGEQDGKEFGLFVIADGMGGLSHGERAADLAITESDRWWKSDLQMLLKSGKATRDNIAITLHELGKEIHYLVLEEAKFLGESMGTTLSLLLLIHGYSYIVHLGDSRIYKVNSHVDQLTKDHTWVQLEVDAGRISQEEALTHKNRNALLQCAGMPGEPEIDIKVNEISNNNCYFLCSDGFYHYIKEKSLLELPNSSEAELIQWLRELENKILKQRAHDNLTAIALTTSYIEEELPSLINKVTNYFK